MVFEQFLESDEIKKHTLFIFLLGIFYVFLGYVVAAYFFPGAVSVAMLFVVTLTMTPSIFVILGIEEEIETQHPSGKLPEIGPELFERDYRAGLGLLNDAHQGLHVSARLPANPLFQ